MFVGRLEGLAGTDNEMVRRNGEKVLYASRFLTKADGCGWRTLPREKKGVWHLGVCAWSGRRTGI